ncbi:MAG: M16 family metallopeptidase [Limisphaerales bacterium]
MLSAGPSQEVRHALTRLPGGVTVVTAAMPHMASVSFGLWVGTGGRYESAAVSGVAHFIEHMLFKGTRRRSAVRISQDVEGVGGYLNAFTSEEQTCFYSKALHDRVGTLADVLFDMLTASRFAPSDIRKERDVIREEVAMYLDQPAQHVQELINAAMWGDHPLGRPLTGTAATLRRIGRREMLAFLKLHYVAPRVVVAAAGRLVHGEIVEIARRLGRGLPAGEALRPATFAEAGERPRVRLQRRKVEQAQVAIGLRTCSRHDDRKYALRLLNVILGENMSSRLFQELREERGLVYNVYSSPSHWDDVGDLVISAGLDTDKLEPVMKLIGRELRRLRDERVPAGEMQRARDYALGQLELSLENTESHMMWLGESVVSTGRATPPAELRRRLAEVSAAEVQAAARAFFQPDRTGLALVSPRATAEPLLAALAV